MSQQYRENLKRQYGKFPLIPSPVGDLDILRLHDMAGGLVAITGVLQVDGLVGGAGVNLDLASADAVGTDAAGWVFVVGGEGSATGGNPGNAFIFGGDAGTGSNDTGALVSVRGGAGDGTGDGGESAITGGPAGVDGIGGAVNIWGGGGGATSGDSGAVNIRINSAAGSGDPGDVNIADVRATELNLGHAAVALGFHGATAVTKQTVTGAHGSNAALQSLLTALAALGLITDSSS